MTKMKNAKEDRFVRIAEQRTQKVLDDLRSLRKCADPASYSYTQEDAEKIVNAIENELRSLNDSFAGKKRFTLRESENRVTIDLGFATLVAEKGFDPNYKEVFIGLEDEQGVWLQDLAVIGGKYHYEKGEVVHDSEVSIKVYSDKDDEDYTHDFSVGLYGVEDEPHKPLSEQIKAASDKTQEAVDHSITKDPER